MLVAFIQICYQSLSKLCQSTSCYTIILEFM